MVDGANFNLLVIAVVVSEGLDMKLVFNLKRSVVAMADKFESPLKLRLELRYGN